MKRIVIAAAATLLASVPFAANALTTEPAPLKVTSCIVAYLAPSNPAYQPGLTNGVTVTVHNTTDKAIASFSGGGIYDKTTVTDSFVHAIAPGASYTFQKNYTPFVYEGSSANCFVSKVTFADGTSWTAPAPAMGGMSGHM